MATIQLFAPPPPAPWDNESVGFMTADLARSGLIPEDLAAYAIASTKYSAPAYLIPYKDNDNLWRCRICREQDKYISTTNGKPDIWIPPQTELAGLYDGDLFIVEGEKKAAAVYKYWNFASVVGIGGCWNAVTKNEKNEQYRLTEKLQILITPGRKVHLILDGDVIENKNVGRAAITLNSCIEALNGVMQLYRPPTEWKGVDDYIFQEPKASFELLEMVPLEKLAINRTLLYTQLECSLGANGQLIANELNAAKLIAYHFKSLQIFKDKRLGFIDATRRPVAADKLASAALHYLQGDISPRYPSGAINGGFTDYVASGDNETDLVQDLIKNRLVWDGVERLETWGSEYFETELPKLANEWGRILFTALVSRILEPGCKVDTVCILNGPQGIGKTTFFTELATIDGYNFYRNVTDLPGSTGDDRTFKQTLVVSLVVDLGEGIIFESRKTSSDRLKQFITDQYDEYRVAYAKNNTNAPRGYILVGTTNRSDQLTDLTGSRRFLYLNTKKIKRLEYPIKLQLLAEVAAKYEEIRKSNWYNLRLAREDLPQALQDAHPHITEVNELLNIQHYRSDPLTDVIQQLLDNDDVSRLKEKDEIIITAAFVSSRVNKAGDLSFTALVGRKFVELGSSPIFPYTFERVRKRTNQVNYKQGHKEVYNTLISNEQGMFTGFIVKRK